MGFFNNILKKLGLAKDDAGDKASASASAAPAQSASVASTGKPKTAVGGGMKDDMLEKGRDMVRPAANAIPEVDVVKMLEEKAKGSGLDWKVSIVDLLKLLDLDSGKDARIELAKELGCPAELIGGDYSKMNVWLHKTVLKKIAENGGNIPASLLD